MNKLISTTAAALLALAFTGTASMAQDSTVIGEVRKIDESAGKITLKHGPIKNLGMERRFGRSRAGIVGHGTRRALRAKG
jgi:Cu(I)/Ag(I) efflux system protein CusF